MRHILSLFLLVGLFSLMTVDATAMENPTDEITTTEQAEMPSIEVFTADEVPVTLLAQSFTEASGETVSAQELDEPPVEELTAFQRFLAWAKENWITTLLALLGIIEIIVRVTPSEKDNAWFTWLKEIFEKIVPNNKSDGGTHASA